MYEPSVSPPNKQDQSIISPTGQKNSSIVVPQYAKSLYTARGRKDARTLREVKKNLNEFMVKEVTEVALYKPPIYDKFSI